jgi:hypothetical protein
MAFRPDSSLSTVTHNALPGFFEHTFIFPDVPSPLVNIQADHSPASLRHTPYPESPLNGLDPMDAAFPSTVNTKNAGQLAGFDNTHRPSKPNSRLNTPTRVDYTYLRESPTLKCTFPPLEGELEFPADERATCTPTSYLSELIHQPMNITPTDRLLHAPSPSQSSFRCQWAGCRSSRNFRRAGDLIRHLRTIHISPTAFLCSDCQRSFGRRDHLTAHVKRRHGG